MRAHYSPARRLARPAVAGALIVSTLAATGCSASTNAKPDAAFSAHTTALCQADGRSIRAHERPFPLTSFNPLDPQPAQLPTVAAFYNAYDWQAALSVQRQMHAQPVPAQGSARWQGYLEQLDRYVATYRAQIVAAEQRNTKAFAATAEQFARMAPGVNAAAAAAGVPACSPFHLGQ